MNKADKEAARLALAKEADLVSLGGLVTRQGQIGQPGTGGLPGKAVEYGQDFAKAFEDKFGLTKSPLIEAAPIDGTVGLTAEDIDALAEKAGSAFGEQMAATIIMLSAEPPATDDEQEPAEPKDKPANDKAEAAKDEPAAQPQAEPPAGESATGKTKSAGG